jgi:hypothetical protein
MGDILYLIEDVSIGLFIFGALYIAWNLRQFWLARQELQTAQFSLERELAERRGGRAITGVLFAVQILVIIWGMSSLAAPTWREGEPESSFTEVPPYNTRVPVGGEGFNPTINPDSDELVILATAAAPSTPQGTIRPSDQRRGCIPDRAWISFPSNGQVIFEPIKLEGTANVQDFAFYRLEIRGNQPGEQFGVLPENYPQPITNSELATFIPNNYPSGEYRLRIVVFDSSSKPQASCEITIFIERLQPTETPTPGGPVNNEAEGGQ